MATSKPATFPATAAAQTIQVPIVYDQQIDEIVISFFNLGETAQFSITSLHLVE